MHTQPIRKQDLGPTSIEEIQAVLTGKSNFAIVCQPGLHVSLLAIYALSQGKSYIPIDSNYPEQRICQILEDSKCELVFTDVSPDMCAPWRLDREIIQLSEAFFNLASSLASEGFSSFSATDLLTDPKGLAYTIFTSGSTGRPKGISISRSNIHNQLCWLSAEGHLSCTTRILQKTPIGFDAAQWEILAPLAGSMAVQGSIGSYRDPCKIVEDVKKGSINSLQAVPALIQAIVDINGFREMSTLSKLFSGGETLSWKLVHEIREQNPSIEIVNLYGPSECTINASAFCINTSIDASSREIGSVPIGTPVANTSFYLDTGSGEGFIRPRPHAQGELIICGEQVGLGYLNNEAETGKRFFEIAGSPAYKTGDLIRCDSNGQLIFVGRTDNQIKLRGNRIELDEISHHYQAHPWVTRAECVVVSDESVTSSQSLVAFMQLSPNAAPLMDGSEAETHHLSKENHLQVQAQLSNLGVRRDLVGPSLDFSQKMAGRLTNAIEEYSFQRKTYRSFGCGDVSTDDIGKLAQLFANHDPTPHPLLQELVPDIEKDPIAAILCGLSAFFSDSRLLPKYSYASPGSLYAIQTFISFGSESELAGSLFYFDPVQGTLLKVPGNNPCDRTQLHFISHTEAISKVYKKNVREVQYFELGHLLGFIRDLLEGTSLIPRFSEGTRPESIVPVSPTDIYLGSVTLEFDSSSRSQTHTYLEEPNWFITVPTESELAEPGVYKYVDGQLEAYKTSTSILQSDVIAINQEVFSSSSFGIGLYFIREELEAQRHYVSLGAALHRLQARCPSLGFMSSGYSSFSGNPLPSALKAAQILNVDESLNELAFYYALAGPISAEQRSHRGMNEDQVHMEGPTEIITRQIKEKVPSYMMPDRVVVMNQLPRTANGKIDRKALVSIASDKFKTKARNGRLPETENEIAVAKAWSQILKCTDIRANDNFFDLGGNSIRVMMLISQLRENLGIKASPQLLFANPTLEKFADSISGSRETSRAIDLIQPATNITNQTCTVMWPGLGGLPLSLRKLAGSVNLNGRVLGIQAQGLNEGEEILKDLDEVARKDIQLLPKNAELNLIGYSFGARVAIKAATQLAQMGRQVRSLALLCPGNPTLAPDNSIEQTGSRDSSVGNPEFLGMLLSVFNSPLRADDFRSARRTCQTIEDAIKFIHAKNKYISYGQVSRIVRLVATQYQFEYTFDEIEHYQPVCPTLVVKAKGDKYSSIDALLSANGEFMKSIEVEVDHYEILKPPFVTTLGNTIRDFQHYSSTVNK